MPCFFCRWWSTESSASQISNFFLDGSGVEKGFAVGRVPRDVSDVVDAAVFACHALSGSPFEGVADIVLVDAIKMPGWMDAPIADE